ncbi:TIGR01244 family sulfur transferase [Actibacterium pelagium]|uniref:Oxidoreductase n=1 Tax=Actibacterium pelagium TaxID=2029103 RepID=A0A917EKD4_9RHOB|nr:TIGR01244 family sulfur transferase [Actibacterium pelagium]GGE56788.1 oxidoreductase [Actibacterium pelagium]
MEINALTADLSVSPQITAADVQPLKELGFRTIICNRPDGEEAHQPPYAEIAEAAKAAGLQFAYLPVEPGTLDPAIIQGFADALNTSPGPVLAYCRSGARSTTLFELVMPKLARTAS